MSSSRLLLGSMVEQRLNDGFVAAVLGEAERRIAVLVPNLRVRSCGQQKETIQKCMS